MAANLFSHSLYHNENWIHISHADICRCRCICIYSRRMFRSNNGRNNGRPHKRTTHRLLNGPAPVYRRRTLALHCDRDRLSFWCLTNSTTLHATVCGMRIILPFVFFWWTYSTSVVAKSENENLFRECEIRVALSEGKTRFACDTIIGPYLIKAFSFDQANQTERRTDDGRGSIGKWWWSKRRI